MRTRLVESSFSTGITYSIIPCSHAMTCMSIQYSVLTHTYRVLLHRSATRTHERNILCDWPVWLRRCVFRWWLLVKRLSHAARGQRYGRSPLCIRMCFLRSVFVRKRLPHRTAAPESSVRGDPVGAPVRESIHTGQLNVFPLWIRSWDRRRYNVLNRLRQLDSGHT